MGTSEVDRQQLLTVAAIIPSQNSLQFVVQDGTYPSLEYDPTLMTSEKALGELGVCTLGVSLTPHLLLGKFGDRQLYVADSILPATTTPAEGAQWVGEPYDPVLEDFARLWMSGFSERARLQRRHRAA